MERRRRSQLASLPLDKSNGYEEAADRFMLARDPRIGVAIVSEWSRTLPRGSSILDIGCGHGIPVSQLLIHEGFAVYGVDASAKLMAAFRGRFPDVHAECAAVEDSNFFGQTFDAVVAWGLMFLLSADVQTLVISKVSRALNPSGRFLFTSPQQACLWRDALTGRQSISLGSQVYQQILRTQGLTLVGEQCDEADNYYYLATKL